MQQRIPAKFERGRVVRADGVLSEFGDDPKRRWLVVLDQDGEDLFCVVSTHQEEQRPDKVPLEWGNTARTGLPEESWAVCKWLVTIQREDLHSVHGILPTATTEKVLETVREYLPKKGGA